MNATDDDIIRSKHADILAVASHFRSYSDSMETCIECPTNALKGKKKKKRNNDGQSTINTSKSAAGMQFKFKKASESAKSKEEAESKRIGSSSYN